MHVSITVSSACLPCSCAVQLVRHRLYQSALSILSRLLKFFLIVMTICKLTFLSILICSKSKVIMEFKKKEKKLKISGQAAAVDETKTAAEELRQILDVDDHEVHRPGKCFRLFNKV